MFYKIPQPTKFMFFKFPGSKGDLYQFSSDLEKIGIQWDVQIQNGTYVEIVSEPMEINRFKYGGTFSVVKIKADVSTDYHTVIKEFWVPINCIIESENYETQSSQFRN